MPGRRFEDRRGLAVVLHVAAFAGAVIFFGLSGLLFAFWAEALAVSVGWILRSLRSGFLPQGALALFSLFFLFVQLQFLVHFAAEESGDVFRVFDAGFAWSKMWPAILLGIATGLLHAIPSRNGEPLPSPMRKVLILHFSIVFGGVASAFLFDFRVNVLLVGALLTALRIADDLVPPRPGPFARLRLAGFLRQ